jgi:hypothetical protein
MRGEGLNGFRTRDALQPDELKMIDEGMGPGGLEAAIADADEARRLSINGSLGEDLQRAHDSALIRPRAREVLGLRDPVPGGAGPAKRSTISLRPAIVPSATAAQKELTTVRSLNVIPNEVVISNFQVSNDHPYRIDLGIEGRTDILIANMSLGVIWINATASVMPAAGQFIGVPLKAMSGANGFDGGVCRMAIRNNKRFWAASVGLGPFLVVVIETAIRE